MSYEEFEEEVKVLGNLKQASSVLGWDEEVMMPENGMKPRSMQKSTLSNVIHERLTSEKLGNLLDSIEEENLDPNQAANVREIRKERKRMKKVSSDLVEKISNKETECVEVWKKSKAENNFEMFAEELEELVELKREYARQISSKKEPYHVLYEDFEPYISYERMQEILEELKQGLKPLIKEIKSADKEVPSKVFQGEFDKEKLMKFNRETVKRLGFDFDKGRLDVSEHPFTSGNSYESRITTWIKTENLKKSLVPTIHECGHALYNLGVPEEYYGTPRGEPRELAIHESQSRLWENHVARSEAFWNFMTPKLEESFPSTFDGVESRECFECVNQVYDDNLIRVEADELTYHLHIVIRFEIERKLINGEIEVEDLPKEWNKRMEDYLGLKPGSVSEGVMQDIHWAWGNFGYFPTYSLGSVIAAQIYKSAEHDIDGLESKISDGDFGPLLNWLRKNIHSKGKLLKTEELVKEATGSKPSAKDFLEYIESKYRDLYDL
jgi:carboxypeptidase Taq